MIDTASQQNADDLNAIGKAGLSYRVRKYAGAWVPIVIHANGRRSTFAHCRTSGAATETAIRQAANIARGPKPEIAVGSK